MARAASRRRGAESSAAHAPGTLAARRDKRRVADPSDRVHGDETLPADAVPAWLGGHFELRHQIGSGSSGTVYRARLTTDHGELRRGTEVAVKFLKEELLADERERERLLAEGALGRSLRHPNVASIHGVETIDVLGLQVTYLVMELVRGTTLRDLVARSGPPVEDLVRRIGADAAAGLFALHRRGLVHRDVKPENLILTTEGTLKIVDLGLVRPFGASGRGSAGSSPGSSPGSTAGTAEGSASGRSSGAGLFGSVAYAAPELLRGLPSSPRSDLYALGVVLFEVATGRHPFADCQHADDMLHAHLWTPPPRPTHLRARISPLLEQVLLDLLQKDPDRRPRDAAELSRILEQGESSEYWRRHEVRAPALASQRRLLRIRRPADAPFCGRTEELRVLDEQYARAAAGRRAAVTVTGPEGIGRRRLCDEVMQGWLDGPRPPICFGGEADSRFGRGEPFASSLCDLLLRGDGADTPRAEERATIEARAVFGIDEADARALVAVAFGRSTEPPEVRADRLASALLAMAAPGRVLVVRVDHAERLDTSGRLVLQRLLGPDADRPLLLLLVAGVDGIEGATARRLELSGLAEADFLEFGRALFRDGAVPEEFLREAHQVLSGVPGNLVESLEQLVQEGLLRGRPGDYHALAPAAEPRPAASHVARFEQRVQRLDPEHRRVLAAAAVLGDRCSVDDLAALVSAPPLRVLETLSLFRGRIVRAQGGEVAFRHPDFQKVLLQQLPAPERHSLHLAAARRLQARDGSSLAIGMHLSQALDHEGCLDPLLDALDERVRAGSQRSTLRLIGRIAAHLGHVPSTPANQRRRLRHLLLGGRGRANAGQREAAIAAFQQAETLARELGDRVASSAARTNLAAAELDRGHLLAATMLLEAVHDELAHAADDGADAQAAQAHGLHGRILLYLGQGQDAQRQLQAALQRLPEQDDDLRCHLQIDLARVEALQHHFATARNSLLAVEREPAARHLPRVRMRLHLYRGQLRALLGDDDATQDLRMALDEANRLSLPSYGGRAALFLGERMFWRRRDDEARTLFALARELAEAGGDRLGEAMARAYLLRLGAEDPSLDSLIDELQMPAVRANHLLARPGGTAGLPPAASAELDELLRAADLPLSMHLRVLAAQGRPAIARSLVRSIGERLPDRRQRRRFLDEWGRGARI